MTSVLSTLPSHFSTDAKHTYPDVASLSMAHNAMYALPPSYTSQHFYSSAEPTSESHTSSHLAATPPSNQYHSSDGQSLRTLDLDSNLAGLAAIADGSTKSNDMSLAHSVLSFPALPADLLDEAPEYEFSTHTRTNVFEAYPDMPLAFGPDGLTMLDPADYGFGQTLPGLENSFSNLGYLDDPIFVDRGDTLPRSLDLYASPSKPALDLARADDSFEAQNSYYQTPHSHSPAVFATPVNGMLDPSRVGIDSATNDGRPSVLRPGPEALLSQQRLSLGYDTMFESQAGPSRVAVRRVHDSLSASNSPHPYGRSAPQQRGAFAQASPSDVLEQRRLSAGGRPHGRDPVVPSQNVGRARMMNWQNDRILAMGNRETHAAASFPTDQFGNPQGFVGHPPEVMHGVQGTAMTASRSLGYDMQGANGNALSQHNMEAHGSDMINALGDAMDARIDVDGIAKCPYPNCNKTFAKNRSYNLKAHLRSHSQVKPFACSVCPRSFSRKHDLERHARVHSGDKPYLCEFCNKGFPRSDALRRHWRVEKECGDKEAALEAGQSLSSIYGAHGAGDSESPDSIASHYQQSMQHLPSKSSAPYR